VAAQGCPKVNLQVRVGNDTALAFYARLGFTPDPNPAINLALRLVDDTPNPSVE
jgi:hypothetical protein